ncbi:hypothetical protein [Bifidobacterium sp. ESL0745]|uniref:helix-turn-helix transcriptional regulator n=1 Tax=Bifidobacterium sp. ESL0745 TaxID=2983226 RepID=UPI0023F8C024|nr:hypothetical protein [Bifidobacterium sp. ESL0745]MDF7666128.1 hypothetical protein [Bifidobacterium sp. ESL0745]
MIANALPDKDNSQKPKESATDDVLCDTKEAANHCGLTVGHMAQLRFVHKGPKYLKPGAKTVKYRLKDLDTWLRSCERGPKSEGGAR